MCADEMDKWPINDPGGRIKILLVDDVDLFLELEKTFFRRDYVNLLVARNGEEALQVLTNEHPDMVFLDLYMPGLNGDEVCRRIKQDEQLKSIPVVMVIQAGSREDERCCREAGCNQILYKPVRREAFMAAAVRSLPMVQRTYPRVVSGIKVSFGLHPMKSLENFTVNLSAGGVFIATGAILTVDTRLTLKFQLPGTGSEIACDGRVAWVNHPDWLKKPSLPVGMGIEFLDAATEQRELLQQFVEQRLSASMLS